MHPQTSSAETLAILRRHGLELPRILTVAITGACNLACQHCWVAAGTSAAPGHVPETTLHTLIAEFAAMGGAGLRFTGGEPLRHPGWLELIRAARAAGFPNIALQTNAMLFTDRDVAALFELDFPGLTLQISLDGASAPAHDRVRGVGAFAGALTGITRLIDGGLGPRLSLFFTEMRHNLGEFPALLELANARGIRSVTSGTIVRCGRAGEGSAVEPPTPAHYREVLDRYASDPRFRELYGRIGTIAALEWQSASIRAECCTFVENPYLTPAGRLYPCVLLHADEYSVPGVFEKGLLAAFAEGARRWSALRRMSRTRAVALQECQACPERQACGGGCMGRAWGSSGKLMAADDRCTARKAVCQQKNAAVTCPDSAGAAQSPSE